MYDIFFGGAPPQKPFKEAARGPAGLPQPKWGVWGGSQRSSSWEHDPRRKSPTLEVVERLLEAADAELAIKPIIDFDVRRDPEVGQYLVPERLWSVPMPGCFSKVQVLGVLFKSRRPRVWDLSLEVERIDYYGWVIGRGIAELMLDSVDGILLMQVWERLHLPGVIREAWQPVIDAATVSQDIQPRDPAGFSAWLAQEIGVEWRPVRRRKPRQ